MHVETEIKYLLDGKDFRRLYSYLKRLYPKQKMTRQINYYFDDQNLLCRSKDLNIRIRIINKKAELTCKIPIKEGTKGNVISSYEYNMNIDMKDALYYIKTGLSALNIKKSFGGISGVSDIDLHDKICYGCLRTTRIAFTVKEDLPPLLMDISRYLGIFDYEIEWELPEIDKAQEILDDILINLGIKSYDGTKPKRHRFFHRLRNFK